MSSLLDVTAITKLLDEHVMVDIKKQHAKYYGKAQQEIKEAIYDIDRLWNTKVITNAEVYHGLFAKLRTYDPIKYTRIVVVPIPGVCDYGPDVIFVPRKVKGGIKIMNTLAPGSVQPVPGKEGEPVIIESSVLELPK